MPGIDVEEQTKLPHIGGDLLFAFGLGGINGLIGMLVALFKPRRVIFISVIYAVIVNFVAYGIAHWAPIHLIQETVGGYFLAASTVSLGSILLQLWAIRKKHRHIETK